MERREALTKVLLNGLELANLGEEIQGDAEVVLRAVWQDSLALECAAPELRRSRRFALQAVQQNGLALQHLDAELQADREVVLEAVARVGFALRWASPELQADPEVVARAVRRDGFALRYAADAMRQDESILLAAVRQNRLALDYVPEALRDRCLAALTEVEAPATPPRRWELASLQSPAAAARGQALEAKAGLAALATPPPVAGGAIAEAPLITPPRPTPPAPVKARQHPQTCGSEVSASLQNMRSSNSLAVPPQAEKRDSTGAMHAGSLPRKRPRFARLTLPPPWPLGSEPEASSTVADAQAGKDIAFGFNV